MAQVELTWALQDDDLAMLENATKYAILYCVDDPSTADPERGPSILEKAHRKVEELQKKFKEEMEGQQESEMNEEEFKQMAQLLQQTWRDG